MIKCNLIKEFIEKKTHVIKRYKLEIIWRDALNKKSYESYYIHKDWLMKFIDIIGLFGAFLSGITFFPQVYRTWKLKSAKELSLTMILIILLSNVVWLVYAFSKQDLAIISANFFVGTCALVILYFKLKYKWI